jgi:2'-5' RNA ligase
MRLFTALDLPSEFRLKLEGMVSRLRPETPIHWSPPENLHITTKFVGEWPEEHLDAVDKALATLSGLAPFEIAIRDLGWFPHAGAPKVLWAGVHGGAALNQLAAATEECLAKLGIARDPRPYAPHLTLARIKNAAVLGDLRARVEQLQPADLGAFTATGFLLYRSEPGPSASVYQKLRGYRLDAVKPARQTK